MLRVAGGSIARTSDKISSRIFRSFSFGWSFWRS